MNANLEGGMLRLVDPNTGANSEIPLNDGSILAQPDKRLTLKLDGTLKELPVELELSFNPLNRLLINRENVDMQLLVQMPDIHLQPDSFVNLPLDRQTMQLGIRFKTSLTTLNPLLDIETTANTPDDLFSHARGRFGFAVLPRDFEAGIMDFLAVGLATAVLPKLGSEDPSQLNCAVGTFDLEDGLMHDTGLMTDTSKMRVAGHTLVNFTDQKIKLELTPKAKTAQIFGLALPVQVTGSFTDFGIGVSSGEAVMTTIRFVSSPVVAPLSWLFQKSMEADGSDLCRQTYNQSRTITPLRL